MHVRQVILIYTQHHHVYSAQPNPQKQKRGPGPRSSIRPPSSPHPPIPPPRTHLPHQPNHPIHNRIPRVLHPPLATLQNIRLKPILIIDRPLEPPQRRPPHTLPPLLKHVLLALPPHKLPIPAIIHTARIGKLLGQHVPAAGGEEEVRPGEQPEEGEVAEPAEVGVAAEGVLPAGGEDGDVGAEGGVGDVQVAAVVGGVDEGGEGGGEGGGVVVDDAAGEGEGADGVRGVGEGFNVGVWREAGGGFGVGVGGAVLRGFDAVAAVGFRLGGWEDEGRGKEAGGGCGSRDEVGGQVEVDVEVGDGFLFGFVLRFVDGFCVGTVEAAGPGWGDLGLGFEHFF